MARHVVAATDEIAPGASKQVEIAGRQIGIYNVHGEFFAISDRCPHEGASLCKGRIVGLAEASEPGKYRLSRSGELVRCPWHGWEFDIRTGKSWCDPQRLKVRSFDVRIESGAAKVEGPYEVETFPVAIEKQLIVVEI